MRFGTKLGIGFAALAVPLAAGLHTAELGAQASDTVAGEAYGTYVEIVGTSQGKTPHALLESGSVMDSDEALSVNETGVISAENLFATTTGAGDTHESSTESSSTLESVNILDGVVTADMVVAMSSSWFHGDRAGSNADGSQFANLVVDGQSIDSDVAPNTEIPVPGVGKVVLNEQIREGDGVNSTGLTVNMIRVVLQDDLTGAKTGEIIVGSTHSAVMR